MFEYLSYWELKSEGHKRHYISEIASLVIELPSKERQSIIASLMTSLNSKLDIEAKTKIRYEEQKRYLLSQMFIWTSARANIVSALNTWWSNYYVSLIVHVTFWKQRRFFFVLLILADGFVCFPLCYS